MEGSHCIGGQHRFPSLGPPSSRSSHRQLYKRCMDDVPRHASVHLHVQCSSAPGCICVNAIHPRCTTVDHLRVEDNLFVASLIEEVFIRSITEMKDVGSRWQHPRLEDTVQVGNSFSPKLECVVGPGIACPGHSHDLICLEWASIVRRELKIKSLNSLFPLRRSK